MNEYSYEFFDAQVKEVKRHVEETWPDWMKNTSGLSTASFPVVNTHCEDRSIGRSLDCDSSRCEFESHSSPQNY
jgi:hypothetical protein